MLDIGDFIRDRGDRRKSQSLHRAHLAIFADRGDRRIKSPSVSLALETASIFSRKLHSVVEVTAPRFPDFGDQGIDEQTKNKL